MSTDIRGHEAIYIIIIMFRPEHPQRKVRRMTLKTRSPPVFFNSASNWVCDQFELVQDGMCALGKPIIMRFTLSLRSFPDLAFETVSVFVDVPFSSVPRRSSSGFSRIFFFFFSLSLSSCRYLLWSEFLSFFLSFLFFLKQSLFTYMKTWTIKIIV